MNTPAIMTSILGHTARHVVAALALGGWLLGIAPASAQDLTVDVVRDPAADTVMYTATVTGPSSGRTNLFAFPLLNPNWVLPGSIFVPQIGGWSGSVIPFDPGIWNLTPSFLSPNIFPQLLLPPHLLVFESQPNQPGLAPGESLGGFGYRSSQLPINGPAVLRTDLQLYTIDPAVPGPQSVVSAPATFVLVGVGVIGMLLRRRRGKT